MAKLWKFLEKLASDEEFEKEFDKDADKEMEKFGLDKDQKELIHTGTAKQIRKELEKKSELGKKVLVFRVKRG